MSLLWSTGMLRQRGTGLADELLQLGEEEGTMLPEDFPHLLKGRGWAVAV